MDTALREGGRGEVYRHQSARVCHGGLGLELLDDGGLHVGGGRLGSGRGPRGKGI